MREKLWVRLMWFRFEGVYGENGRSGGGLRKDGGRGQKKTSFGAPSRSMISVIT